MTGQRGLNRNLGGFVITNLTDHNDVRVLAHDGTQPRGKAEADLGFDVDLVDTAQLVLDRVLDGNDLFVGRVDFVQSPVQCGRLSAPGRSRHQDHAVGLGNHGLE